jgi:hypothetical protein
MTGTQADGMRDAAAWLQAFNDGDTEGFHTIAQNCDPTELVDSLTAAFLWVIREHDLNLSAVLQLMRDSADRYEEKP